MKKFWWAVLGAIIVLVLVINLAPLIVRDRSEMSNTTVAPESEPEQMVAWLNRGEGLGQFEACEAEEIKSAVWHVTLCVPDPHGLSESLRSLMKSGVGLQAISVLRELEGHYPGRLFVVWIKGGSSVARVKYGYAFRKTTGPPAYMELRTYR